MTKAPKRKRRHRWMRADRLILRVTKEEADYVKHAASLSHESVALYVRKAINERLQRHGVNAVLLREAR